MLPLSSRSPKQRLKRYQHATIAGAALIIAGVLSDVGIVTLIAEGYGTIAWGFLFVYLIPLFTVGIYRLRRAPASEPAGADREQESEGQKETRTLPSPGG